MTKPVAVTITVDLPVEAMGALADEIAAKLAEQAMATMRTPSTSPYMTIPEAADYLRCSRQRIDDLLSSRRLTRVKEGRRTLVLRAEINACLRTFR